MSVCVSVEVVGGEACVSVHVGLWECVSFPENVFFIFCLCVCVCVFSPSGWCHSVAERRSISGFSGLTKKITAALLQRSILPAACGDLVGLTGDPSPRSLSAPLCLSLSAPLSHTSFKFFCLFPLVFSHLHSPYSRFLLNPQVEFHFCRQRSVKTILKNLIMLENIIKVWHH